MRFPNFSQKPEQMSLFPSTKVPLRIRLRSQFKRLLFLAIVTTALGIDLLKLAFNIWLIVETYPRTFFYLTRSFEEDETLWFFWLMSTLSVLYLTRRGFFGENVTTRYINLAVGGALLIYLGEVALAIWRFTANPTSAGVPWSFYITGVGLIILTLWKLPARQLAPWRQELEAKDYLTILNSTRTILLQIVGGAIVILGLYYTAQNMRIAQENVRFALLKEESDRLNQAITQLKDENPEVRLVAIYNLQTIATKSIKNYRLITSILIRYVHAHATWKETQARLSPEEVEARADIHAVLIFLNDLETPTLLVRNDDTLKKIREYYSAETLERYAERLLGSVNLSATDLRRLELEGANMEEWILTSAHLENSSMAGANLRSAVLDGADLSGTDLRSTDLSSASLKNANLSKANLFNTIFKNTDVEGADFTESLNLSADTIKNAKNYDKAKLPPSLRRDLNLSDR